LAPLIIEFLDCGVPGWQVVTDQNGEFCWVNEQKQMVEQIPPNFNQIKADFQELRRKYVRELQEKEELARNPPKNTQSSNKNPPSSQQRASANNASASQSKPTTQRGAQPSRVDHSNPSSQNKTSLNFDLMSNEPRRTFESSQTKLDPRQALFQSKESKEDSMHGDQIDEDELVDEGSFGQKSDDREEDDVDIKEISANHDDEEDNVYEEEEVNGAEMGPSTLLGNSSSNAEIYQKLQEEIEIAKRKVQELQQEHVELRETNKDLTQNNITLSKQSQQVGSDMQSSVPKNGSKGSPSGMARSNESGNGVIGGLNCTGTGSILEAELKEIKRLLQESIKSKEQASNGGASNVQSVPINNGSATQQNVGYQRPPLNTSSFSNPNAAPNPFKSQGFDQGFGIPATNYNQVNSPNNFRQGQEPIQFSLPNPQLQKGRSTGSEEANHLHKKNSDSNNSRGKDERKLKTDSNKTHENKKGNLYGQMEYAAGGSLSGQSQSNENRSSGSSKGFDIPYYERYRGKRKYTDPLALSIYHKWKEILGMEWRILNQTESRLDKEKKTLQLRKKAVQQFEWDSIVAVRKENGSETATSKILDGVKHVIFHYELDAEKLTQLGTLFESRIKKLTTIEKFLDKSFRRGELAEPTDAHLTILFNQYIDTANLYEHKLRINTELLVPYGKSSLLSKFSTPFGLSNQPEFTKNNFNRTQFVTSGGQVPNPIFTNTINLSSEKPNYSVEFTNLDFIKNSLSRIKEGGILDGSIFSEINDFFEKQQNWFEMIKQEIKVIMRKLDNPTTISGLH
jgi:hypothetical protein